MGSATTAARQVVSSSTLIGPFEFVHECEGPLSHASSQASEESRRGEFEGKVFALHKSFGLRSTSVWS